MMVNWYWLLVVWIVTEVGTLLIAALVSANALRDPVPELDESHAATRYGERREPATPSPSARFKEATPEEIEAARRIVKYGGCNDHNDVICGGSIVRTDGKTSFRCPGPSSHCKGWICCKNVASARAWLAARGLSVEEDVLPGVPM